MKNNWPTKKLKSTSNATVSLEKKVRRGKESWNFFYIAFVVLITIGLFVISILEISWVGKIILGFFVAMLISYLCLWNARFQNKLIWLKNKIEESWKTI